MKFTGDIVKHVGDTRTYTNSQIICRNINITIPTISVIKSSKLLNSTFSTHYTRNDSIVNIRAG